MYYKIFFSLLVFVHSERLVCLDQEMIKLSNGVEFPRVGFGLAAMRGEDTRRCVREHLKRGFMMMDGAESTEWYDDATVGDELSKLGSLYDRKDVFIVSKVHPTRLSFKDAYQSVLEMLDRWNHTSYLDLVLLHYPECGSWIPNCKGKTGGDWKGAWKALERHYEEGRLRAIGVSNFEVDRLIELENIAKHGPHVIQSWLDPFYQNREVYQFAVDRGIAFTSYSSFGMQWQFNWVKKNLVFESPTLNQIANEKGVPVTSVVLAWLLKKQNMTVIPRSTDPKHIEENSKFLQPGYYNEIISDEDYERIENLDGVFDAADPERCQEAVENNECGDDMLDGWCRASCQGVEW